MAVIPQNLITAFPFWDAKEKQTFRQFYCEGSEEIGALQCRQARHLPWIIKGHASAPTYIYLVDKDGLNAINITARLTIGTITVDGNQYTYHEGQLDFSSPGSDNEKYGWNGTAWVIIGDESYNNFIADCNLCYYEISFGGTKYFSELMQISDFAELSDSTDIDTNRFRLECVNSCALADIPAAIVAQKLFIKANASDPEYITTKDVGEDGNDDTVDLWVKMVKRYKVKFYAIETVADWIASVPLYDIQNAVDQYGFQSPIKDFSYQIQWPEEQGGCLALIEFSFVREYIAQTGCC